MLQHALGEGCKNAFLKNQINGQYVCFFKFVATCSSDRMINNTIYLICVCPIFFVFLFKFIFQCSCCLLEFADS